MPRVANKAETLERCEALLTEVASDLPGALAAVGAELWIAELKQLENLLTRALKAKGQGHECSR